MKAVEIKWETDGLDINLPTCIEIPQEISEERVADYLSDTTGYLVQSYNIENRPEEHRRLLHCELFYKKTPSREQIKKVVSELDTMGLLMHFRQKLTEPYLIWENNDNGSITLRLVSPYDVDIITEWLNRIEGVLMVKTSWFPSRHEYGGTVKNGKLVEKWDI